MEAVEYAKLAEYGIEGYVVKKSAWDRDVQAFSRDGRIYIREGIDEIYRGMVVPHEATHVMKQLEYQLYLDFLARTPEMFNISSPVAMDFLSRCAEHRNIDLMNADEGYIQGVYDELNAAMYGEYAAGNIKGENKAKLDEAFYDFDAYISELEALHEQFKKDNLAAVKREKQLAAERETVTEAGRRLGRKVVFEDTLETQGFKSDGYIDGDGVIHIDYDNTAPLQFIFKHELTHFGEGHGSIQKLC